MEPSSLSEVDRARIRAEEEFRYEIRRERHLKRLVIAFVCVVIGVAAIGIRSSFSGRAAADSAATSTVQDVTTIKALVADSICGRDEFEMDQLQEMASDGIVQLLREEAVRMAKAHSAIALHAGTRVRVEYQVHSYSRITPLSGPEAGASACLVPSALIR